MRSRTTSRSPGCCQPAPAGGKLATDLLRVPVYRLGLDPVVMFQPEFPFSILSIQFRGMDYQWLHRAESARLRPTPVAPHILLSFCRKYRLSSGYLNGIEIRS